MTDEPKVLVLSDKPTPEELQKLRSVQDDHAFNDFMQLATMCANPTGWAGDDLGYPRKVREPIGTVFQNDGGKAEMPERPETKRDRQRAKRLQKRSK